MQDLHPCHYRKGQWNGVMKGFDAGKDKYHGPQKVVKKFRNYVYAVTFLVVTATYTLVDWLNLPTKDLPGAPLSRSIAWIWLFDFNVKPVPGRLQAGPDSLSRPLRGDGNTEPEQEDNREEIIEASLWGIRVK